MSSQVKEIEIKAKVKGFGQLRKKLTDLGCKFSKPLTQKDSIYLPKGISFDQITPGLPVLRIRQQGKKNLFTLKQVQESALSKIEKEVEINDAKVMHQLLEALDYYIAVEVNKKRIKAKYKDLEICLDEVKGLGSFIEIEKITSGDGRKVQDELFKFLESLGINQEDKVTEGYDVLLNRG